MNQSEKHSDLIDMTEIKKQAEESIKQGAVTPDYPLDLEEACRLLNGALATEVMCILRYRHHQIIAKGIDRIQIAAEFEEHAIEEEQHMLKIAERINQLGGNPDFSLASIQKNAVTDYGRETGLLEMVQEDLVAERIAIEVYRKMIQWFGMEDPTTRRMLEHILEEEEEHANDLAELLARDTKRNKVH